jgi:hypothetical protein
MRRPVAYALIAVGVVALGFVLGRLTAPASRLKAETASAPANRVVETINSVPPPIAVPERALVVETPVDEAAASGPFEVSGRALGKSLVKADLKDGKGEIVWSGSATLAAAGFQPFTMTAETAEALKAGAYLLTVVRASDDGKDETVTRDVAVGVASAVKIKVFFSKSDASSTDCQAMSEAERLVSIKDSVYRASIEELLKGPTKEEEASGLVSSLPAGVTLKSVAADANGVVTADFSSRLGKNVAGSCRVGAIRAQIRTTLAQFPEVHDVIIAIDGQTEGILQP